MKPTSKNIIHTFLYVVLEYASDIVSENYTCKTEGNITVYVNASDEFVYENTSITFCCTNIVSRNWMLKADDLQITPPGDISFQFSYTGEEKYFPMGAQVDFDFGDGNSKSYIVFENENRIIEETYSYELQGVYNVTVKVYNIFDEEFFNSQVTILEKMGNLEVFAQYSIDESQELTNLHGPDETDVPINSIVSFTCKISGSVDNFIMTLKDKTVEQTKEEDIFSNQFDEVGKYRVSFLAKNFLEESNNVTLELRVMSEPVGLSLQASSSDVLLDEELEFTISFEFIDQFTCILFDAGDEEIKQAFGSKEMCETLEDENFHFNSRHSDRKRRDAGEISWIDDNTISIIYAYRSDGLFKPVAKAFNTIFETNSSTKVKASYPPSSIWIENNSTNIKRPMRFFREENFRLETTALLMDRPSNSYEMSWEVNKITDEEDVIESIDISGIRSSSCSALRFPHRFLDVGLYKIRYFVTISNNGSLNQTMSCFTYLEIMSGPLQPMIIHGGASYILRGYNQLVYLEPSIYSVDPDNPDDKNFEIEWFCRSFDAKDFFNATEEYDKQISLSEKSITQVHIDQRTENGKCFKGNKEEEKMDGPNFVLNTGDLRGFFNLYEFKAIVTKDKRNKITKIYIDVIEDIPPGIILRCEKSVACIVTDEGFIVNPTDFIAVRAECVTECGDDNLVYDWEIYGVHDTTKDKEVIDNWKDSVVIDEDRLGINRTLFLTHGQYRSFHVQVRASDSKNKERAKGVAKLYLHINKPPNPGTCTLSNNAGLAMITIFNIEFNGFKDPDNHALTDYSVYIVYKEVRFHIHYGIKTSADFILPPGEMEIICAVRDKLGAVTELSAGFVTTSMPSDEERDDWEETVNVNFFVAEGKMSLVSQAVAAEAYVDEEVRHERDGGFEAQVDAIWEHFKELEGIDTSYFTKEAREEIEAQVRDERAEIKEESAEVNLKMFQSLEILPFEVLYDAEVYGQAVSALAETRPLNKESKAILNGMIKDIYEASQETEVAHPADKEIANMLLANSMNCLSRTLSEEVIGGNFLPSELEEAYEYLSFNITQPNFFILYVEGSRWEVEEKVHMKKVEGVKNFTLGEINGQVKQMKNITDELKKDILKDIMVGETPLVVDTSSGFQLQVEKRHAGEIGGETMQNRETSITMPGPCTLLGKNAGCEESTPIGLVSVKWSSILETEGTDDVSLSADSSSLDLSLTNREGNETLKIENAEDPFEICLSLTPPSDDGAGRRTPMRFVKPSFTNNDDFLVYHHLSISGSGAAVKVEFRPEEQNSPFVFFYGVGYKPSLSIHDGKEFMKNSPKEGDSYSMLFSADSDEGEDFFFAVGLLSNSSSKNEELFKGDKNLTRSDMTNSFTSGYFIALYTTGCYYFSEETSEWSGDGCKVHAAKANKICCLCNHLTMFGSGFLVAPNTIDFDYVFANTKFENNLTIYLTLIITFATYVLLAIWARWKDRKDLTKLGATPLADNDMADKYFYEILVQTGFPLNAGTDSKVHFILSGEDDETDVRTFSDEKREIFKRGSLNSFVMSVPRCLGQLNYLRIWHDNSGKGKNASWYLKHIVVKDIHTGYKYEIIAERWFAVEEGDGLIDYLIPVAGKEQTTEFSHLFSNASRRNLTDNHLWLSVFTRPERSRFTRLQRLSCCMAMLYLSMLTDAMWYETVPEQPSPGAFKLGPLQLSPEQIGIGLLANLIVFPPSFIMIVLFRKSRVRKLRPSHVNIALGNQYKRWRKEYGLQNSQEKSKRRQTKAVELEEEVHWRNHSKKKCLLPWWCSYIGWLFVIASIACSIFFIWAYALQFGNEKTRKWLTSLVVAFFSSVFLTEPLKIFLLALVMACVCGNPDVADDDLDDDEEDPYLKEDEEWLHDVHTGVVVQRPKYRPIDPHSLDAARKLREKEVQMYQVLREMGAYILYLWILMILSYGNRDPNSFFIREALINGFIKPGDLWNDFNNVNTEVRFWNWTRHSLIPELFAMEWYNGRPPLGLRLYLDDRNNFKIGYPVLRQVRARTDSCTVPYQVENIIDECAGFGNVINEDDRFYKKFWHSNLTMSSRVPPEYKYMTAKDLNGFPFWGQLDWYGGGGYIVPLVTKRYTDGAKLISKMDHLEKTGWIDKDTRAVFVEFGTYNPQVNLFVVLTIVAEFLPGGGVVPYYHIDPIKLLHYHTGAGLLILLCQIGFILFTIYYTICAFVSACKQGKKYFKEYWNIAEIANILAAYSIIGVEIYKMIITQQILAIFTKTEGTGYIKLQEALLLDEAFCYLIGFLMSLATLKFLKLLRFNKRIGGMISTVRLCVQELKGYSVCLIITFIAFVCLFWMTLGRGVREFCSFLASFESSISMLLKKFNYHDMEAASPILAPIAFFTFALTASVILVNILLTIIIQSFEDVKRDTALQSDAYQLMEFMIRRLKLMLGIGKEQSRIAPVVFATAKKEDNNIIDSFNGKVDLLLDFINSVYLDDQMDIEFLNKSRAQLQNQLINTEPKKKKYRPRRIPRYQPQQVKKILDF
nr:uncharacterized protein LOC107445474 [Parasteatoda tepidariorum]